MKRILMVSFRLPWPEYKGGYIIRLLNFVKIIRKKYKVDLVTVARKEPSQENVKKLKNYFNKIIIFKKSKLKKYLSVFGGLFSKIPLQNHYYYSREMHDWIKKNFIYYDCLYCNLVRTVEYAKGLKIHKILDMVDAISLNYTEAEKYSNLIWKIIYKLEIPRLKLYESDILDKNIFDKIFLASRFDKEYLEKNLRRKTDKIKVIPQGVNEELFKKEYKIQKLEEQICFFGKMDYQPNVDAAYWFAKEVFPLLKKKLPNLKFLIIGTNPAKKILNLKKNKDIIITGFVRNPYLLIKKSKIVVSPIRFGAGMQNKILESMALSKAVIASLVSVRGIMCPADKKYFEVIKKNCPEIWSRKIISLFFNPQKRIILEKAAKEMVKKNYSWKMSEEKLLTEIKKII